MNPSEEMGFGLTLRKKSSKQQSRSESAKDGSNLLQPNPSPKDSLKLKSKIIVGQASSDSGYKAKHNVVRKVQHLDSAKGSSTPPDELVKYMSSLPEFLKRSDGGESIQGKALNVGVLDWSKLEKWKNKQTHTKAEASNFTSFNSSEEASSTAATTSSTISVGHNKKLDGKKGLSSSRSKGPYKEDLGMSSKMSSQNVKQDQHSEIKTKTIGDELGMSPSEFGKTQSVTSLQRVKVNDYDEITSVVGSSASKSRHHGVSVVSNENSSGRNVEDDKRMEGLHPQSLKKKERNRKSSSDKGFSSLESKNKGVSFRSQKKMSSGGSELKNKMDQWQESDIDAGHKQSHRMPSNIVLLRPRRVLQLKSEDYFQHSQSRTSSDEDLGESSRSSVSYMSIPEEIYTEDLHSEIPHSKLLPSVAELVSSERLQQSNNTNLDIGRSSGVHKKASCSNNTSSLKSEYTCIEKDVLDIKLKNQCAFSNSLEPRDHGIPEPTPVNPSSNRRLSVSLSRIGRSFSFKEGSIPKLSSVYVSSKSGSVTPESSACLENHSKYKVKGHNRTRSSPLLRLLDPILKHKTSSIHLSDEHSVTSKGSIDSISLRTISLPEGKSKKESSFQALLQLTIRNGVPLFKFVINSERKVLAATTKSLALEEKDDLDCYFTFYLVNEIKKKSSKWMSHWSKEKSCGYAYNIVGKMRVSNSKIDESNNENSKRERVVKEYVLMGVEVDQVDRETSQFFMSKELAAVVIEIPCENINHEELLYSHNLPRKICLKCLADEKCFCSAQENDIYGSIKVILPGGLHSSPNTGEPSPLIQRWKLGGLCDCGGWDVGCKLLVLSNQNISSNIPRSSKSYLERFHLFVQVCFYFSSCGHEYIKL